MVKHTENVSAALQDHKSFGSVHILVGKIRMGTNGKPQRR